jgi:glycosyltransferase involved in cell wall biosynthesis
MAAWVMRTPVIIRTGGDFVWERYVERTGELVQLSMFYTGSRDFTLKERLVVWLQRHMSLRFATRIVFSTAWQRDLWKIPYKLPLAKTALIENAIEARTSHEHEPVPRVPPTFVWVGRDLVLKNVRMLERAVAELKKEQPDIALTQLKNVPHCTVLATIATARGLVIPSLSEVSPNLVFEAIALGTPVILTEDTGVRSMVEGVVRFVDPLSEPALVEALREMTDPIRYGEWRERVRGYRHVHTYDDIAREFLVLFKHL